MTLGKTFPRTAAEAPDILDWGREFSWVIPTASAGIELVFKSLISVQTHGLAAFHKFAEALRDDLVSATQAAAQGLEASNIDAARFIISVPPAAVCLSEGHEGDAYGWLNWGTSRTYDFNARSNKFIQTLPPYAGAAQSINQLARSMLLDWFEMTYRVARLLGGMDETARRYAPGALAIIVNAIATGHQGVGVAALVALTNWATKDGHDVEAKAVKTARALFDLKGFPARERLLLGSIFVTHAARLTERSPTEWARLLLAEFGSAMHPDEKLQLQISSIDGSKSWEENSSSILVGIREMSSRFKKQAIDDIAAVEALEARVDIIHPLISRLVSERSLEGVMDVLRAWYASGVSATCNNDVLFISPTHPGGVTYLWPGGGWFVVDSDSDGLEEMLETISTSLNDYFRGPGGDRDVVLDDRLLGFPAFAAGGTLQDRVGAHYGLDRVLEKLPPEWRPRSLVIFPTLRDPAQAVLLKTFGWFAPMEASLAAALPAREIGTISIWPGFTHLTEAEVECLCLVAAQAGWHVKQPTGELNAESFRQFYEDTEADVLWIVGHGEHSAFDAAKTGLMLDDGSLLPIGEIQSMARPDAGRRLLVLNICSSGATQSRAGLARVGIGHQLVGADQQVIGHLWPVDGRAALAFGCGLAVGLSERPLIDAFASALSGVRDLPELLTRLGTLSANVLAHDRLNNPDTIKDMTNVLNWGCPILLT